MLGSITIGSRVLNSVKKSHGSAVKVEERLDRDGRPPRNSGRHQTQMDNKYMQGLETYIESTWCISKSLDRYNEMSLLQNPIAGRLCCHFYLFPNVIIMCVKMLLP